MYVNDFHSNRTSDAAWCKFRGIFIVSIAMLPTTLRPWFRACQIWILVLTIIPMLPVKGAPEVVESLDIAPVWSAHPVDFCLITHEPHQFVAFYDDKRQLTVAQRKLKEKTWTFTKLPITTAWDSHNYITMTIDDDGYLHLSGDMHCVPLNYFRSEKPHDASSLARVSSMTGHQEERTTYPKFLRGPGGKLIFMYRDGSSGDGNQIINQYDLKNKSWKRMLEHPLTDGEGQRNAYFSGPVLGPDDYFHLSWVWRETPDASTNHDLSYARSKNLIDWETAGGKPLRLPIRLGDGAVVDPIPVKGGIINGNHRIGFDTAKRVILSYHKNDAQGHTQPWNARWEDGAWKFSQITDWPWTWEFSGGGTLGFGIHVGSVNAETDGTLTQSYRHEKFGGGSWQLDPKSLKAIGKVRKPANPASLGRLEGNFPGLRVRTKGDDGMSPEPSTRYLLRWETLEANRDQPRPEPWPSPSMLRVYQIKTTQS